jgi:uncharacterized spore protein YtfJ
MSVGMTHDAGVLDTLREVADNTTVGKVFGTPIDQEGTIVLPVAKVGTGGGGGSGSSPAGEGHENSGVGGGFGVSAKPLGVFVLRNGKVAWRPAIDVNRAVLGGQAVAVVGLLVARAVINARVSRRRDRWLRSMARQAPRLRARLASRLPRSA